MTAWRRLVVEAALCLAVARVLLRLLPFKRMVWLFNLTPTRGEPSADVRARVLVDVPRAIAAAARRLPGDSVCFPRAIAAQAMLRRRGLGTTLYYGAARSPERRLDSHVWLRYHDQGIVGHELADQYRVVVRFPAPR